MSQGGRRGVGVAVGVRLAAVAAACWCAAPPMARADTTAAPVPQLSQPSRTTWMPLSADDASWSTCAPITYRVNPGPLRGYALTLVRQGLAQVQQATGFDFRYLGTTSAVPGTPRRASGAMLTIAFAGGKQLAGMPVDGAGLGGYASVGSTIVHGDVVLDAHLVATARRARGHIPLKVMLHELGHAMGLGHVANRADRMYPVVTAAGAARYGAGDLLGLQAHGALAAAPCVDPSLVGQLGRTAAG